MADVETTPLLPTASRGAALRRTVSPGGSGRPYEMLSEDDLAIEGMVLALLRELGDRGYQVPNGRVEAPPDMPPEDAESEAALFATVFTVPRHRQVLGEYLPPRPATKDGGPGDSNAAPSLPTPTASTSRPSPASSQVTESSILEAPSALFLCALLSLLVSLQAEPSGTMQVTDHGVDGELRLFKARRDLGDRLYSLVEGLLDSYLLSGDQRDESGEDALVRLLFHDFALTYDSFDRATCAVDLLLNLSSHPLVEAENLVSHPVVLASAEYVWRNGLLPAPKRGEDSSLGWRESALKLDRFSVPRILHTQSYLFATIHAAITIYILMFSAYAHFYTFNPLAPDYDVKIPENGSAGKGSSLLTSVIWWLWIAGTFGWAGEVGRAWHHRGPHPSLPLSPSTLLPLVHHMLVFASLVLRILLIPMRRAPAFILASSLSMLAWSIPFLAASRILPQNLPAFGSPTHQQWRKIRDGRRRRDFGYRSPPKSVPESHRALRAIEAHLGGLVQFASYFAVFGILLLWSLSGELDYPSLFLLPVELFPFLGQGRSMTAASKSQTLSPIEARTTLAFTLVLGVVLAYFAGGRPSINGKVVTPGPSGQRGLTDLDGWDRYGREVAFRARRERLAVTRYFSFVPPRPRRAPLQHAAVPSAFSTPPLTSPLNLVVPPLLLAAFVARQLGHEHHAKLINERGRLWVWRFGISPLGLWALVAKSVRLQRGRE